MVDITVNDTKVLVITVTPPTGGVVVLDPIGVPGTQGGDGWTPVLAVVADGARDVQRIVDWTGGGGTKPAAGAYIGATGEVADIADAVDIRGGQGVPGEQGPAGKDGTVVIGGETDILTGAGAPADTLGIDNQLYLDTVSDDIFKKLSGHWTLQTNIKGAPGPAGLKGDKGDTGSQGVQGLKGDKGDTGDAGSDGAPGPAGTAGSKILTGVGVPSNGLGANGDLYIATDTFEYYSKVAGTWVAKGNIKGADGIVGQDGATIRITSGTPSPSLGNNGDVAFDSVGQHLFFKSAGAWADEGDLRGATGAKGDQGDPGVAGPKGDKGDTGTPGADGANGATIIVGSVDPDPSLGNDGDEYFQTTSKHLFNKVAGAWEDLGSLKGDQGDPGPQGVKGDQGEPGAAGPAGADGAPGTDGTDGTDGAPGADGVRGSVWFVHAGVPTSSGISTMLTNDLYLNSTNDDIYQWSGTSWGSPVSNIKGAPGPAGADGSPGTPALNVADAMMFFPGKIVAATQLMFRTKLGRAFNWPANMVGSKFECGTAPTASAVFLIKQNGTTVVTVTYAAGSATATVVSSAVAWAIGDVMTVTGPAAIDTTMADIDWYLLGSR